MEPESQTGVGGAPLRRRRGPCSIKSRITDKQEVSFGSTHPIVISVTVAITGTVPATRVYVNHKREAMDESVRKKNEDMNQWISAHSEKSIEKDC